MADAGHFGVPEALAELRRHRVIDADYVECVALGSGTGPELAVKPDQHGVLWAAARFLQTYRDCPLVPTARHVDLAHRFLVYGWEPGVLVRGSDAPVEKAQTLLSLTRDLLGHYVPAEAAIGCWLHELYGPEADLPHGRTWQEFLGGLLSGRHAAVRSHLPRGAAVLVRRLAAAPGRQGGGPLYLLHGGCGGDRSAARGRRAHRRSRLRLRLMTRRPHPRHDLSRGGGTGTRRAVVSAAARAPPNPNRGGGDRPLLAGWHLPRLAPDKRSGLLADVGVLDRPAAPGLTHPENLPLTEHRSSRIEGRSLPPVMPHREDVGNSYRSRS